MIYAFVFLGEFGYELFNWQGLVRKFKTTCSPADKIVIGGRPGMDIWYPYADAFVDISEDPLYKKSRADRYWAYDNTVREFAAESVYEIKASVHALIEEQIKDLDFCREDHERIEFIFSSDTNALNGIFFGPWQETHKIYSGDGHKQNLYAKIDFDSDELKRDLEARLQMNLSEPYVLFQSRKRDIVIRSTHVVPTEELMAHLAEKINVVALNFDTGRALDSKSEIIPAKNCHVLKTASAHEQAILIKYAAECVFTTENDFGSHIYVPPFMGRDVVAVAGADVYQIGSTPIDFWNDNIFKFGGKIIPFVSEQIFASEETLNGFCKFILKRATIQNFFVGVENMAKGTSPEDFYLWPYTPPPPNSHQERITQRVGTSDYDTDNPKSRSSLLIKFIDNLIRAEKIPQSFTLADICGGDAVVATMLKKNFPQAEIIVQDCFKGKFSTHEQAASVGVKLYGGWLQHLVEKNLPKGQFDIVTMLNTFRDWYSAQLHENEQDLPIKTLRWFERNSKIFVVTATEEQIAFLKNCGFKVAILGKGEDSSFMICVSK